MNAYEIEKHPEINGGQGKIIKEQTHTEITEHGAKRVVIHQTSFSNKEPDYIKFYTDCQLVFNHLDVALSPYIVAFGKYMTWANEQHQNFRCIIQTTKIIRQAVAEQLHVSDRQVQRAIKDLVDGEIFIPIFTEEINRKTGEVKQIRMRAAYFVNPWVMSKGDWKDIKVLRQEFEFVEGVSSTCAIDIYGNRKVIMPLTQRANHSKEANAKNSEDSFI